jgi:hypothetical protein
MSDKKSGHLCRVFTVEVATRDNFLFVGKHHLDWLSRRHNFGKKSVCHKFATVKGYRVVCGTVDFSVDDATDEIDGIADDSVHLWTASHGVSILNLVAKAMAL